MQTQKSIFIAFFMLSGCSILNPGYLSSPPNWSELKVNDSSYADVTSELGGPAVTRITFGESVHGTWWYKVPSANVDRIGMISGSYSQNCQKCGKVKLGFRWTSDDPTNRGSARLITIDNHSPSLQQRHKKGEKAICHKRFKKAYKIMSSLADNHYTPAEHALGVMNAKGDGTEQDYKRAFNLFLRAAQKGYAAAQYDLGVMYENGEYVQQDMRKAVSFFKLSADQKYHDAARSLARILEQNGKPEKAKKYRKIAKENPHPKFPEECDIKK